MTNWYPYVYKAPDSEPSRPADGSHSLSRLVGVCTSVSSRAYTMKLLIVLLLGCQALGEVSKPRPVPPVILGEHLVLVSGLANKEGVFTLTQLLRRCFVCVVVVFSIMGCY